MFQFLRRVGQFWNASPIPSRAAEFENPAAGHATTSARTACMLRDRSGMVAAPDGSGRGDRGTPGLPPCGVQLYAYDSLLDLRQALTGLDRPDGAMPLTVILTLDHWFSGHLPSLIERQHPALRLIIVVPSGRLTGGVTIGDLDASSRALGWQVITLERGIEQALGGVLPSLAPDALCVLFWPAWQNKGDILSLLERRGCEPELLN